MTERIAGVGDGAPARCRSRVAAGESTMPVKVSGSPAMVVPRLSTLARISYTPRSSNAFVGQTRPRTTDWLADRPGRR